MMIKRKLFPFILSILIILSKASPGLSQKCGCNECTDDILERFAGLYKCGARIDYRVSYYEDDEIEACRIVAGKEFPTICGHECDPDRCDSSPAPITPSPTFPPIPSPSSLYCFPLDDGVSRVTYDDLWDGSYKVQVKEGNICGPGENRFSRNTVSRSGDDLIFQFKKNAASGVWEASEVRIVLPDGSPFEYGNYTFHVKSVAVKNSDDTEVSNILPANLVLGLFTWDPTDRYSERENYSHEVDIEVSRWGALTNADTQFLVQPPGSPQMFRFYSGLSPNTYDQSNQWHSFRWLPNKIWWSSTAGGGQSHSYSTEEAVTNGIEDYVQCLPAEVEIRINLWSMDGQNTVPQGLLADDQYVEVIIDNFTYEKAGIDFAEPGDYCSKHCQCEAALGCHNGQCIAVPQSPVTSPSAGPSQSPSLVQQCIDALLPAGMIIHKATGRPRKFKKCDPWVKKKPIRCNKDGVSETCPKTCGTSCDCEDSPLKFKVQVRKGKIKKKDCDWVKEKAGNRCKMTGVKSICRQTCGECNNDA
jgi:hypothetical protein